MYNPSSFAEDRVEVLHAFIREYPFATVISCGPNGPEATHVPVVLHGEIGANGVLRCHFARPNRHWETIRTTPTVLAILQGLDHYITPNWYPSKHEHGKVVPTWNYVAVHVRGQARLVEGQEELREHLRALTDQSEYAHEKPWSIDDAPREYVDALSKGIVGIEIEIVAIEGKWKVSQNRPDADREGVVAGLTLEGSSNSIAMAQLVQRAREK